MKKNCPQKLLIIPLDQEFSVQKVFALCNWDSFLVLLIFEVVNFAGWKWSLRIADAFFPTTYLFPFGIYVEIFNDFLKKT